MVDFLFYKIVSLQPQSLELWHVSVFFDYYITESHTHRALMLHFVLGKCREQSAKDWQMLHAYMPLHGANAFQ